MNESFLEGYRKNHLKFAFALESCVTLPATMSLFQQLLQIVAKEKNRVKQMKWDPFSLDASFVSGRSEEIRTIWLFSSKFEWPLPGAQLQLTESGTDDDF